MEKNQLGSEFEAKARHYFTHIELICGLLIAYYCGKTRPGNQEMQIVAHFLEKLKFSLELLRSRYRFWNENIFNLALAESGFPLKREIDELLTALGLREERLGRMRTQAQIKRAMLEHMLKQREVSVELLQEMSERVFCDRLEESRMFLPFTHGTLVRYSGKAKVRGYIYSWGCYDFSSNQPYIHILLFDQDVKSQPLEEKGENFKAFLNTVQFHGSRAPKIGILAMQIDRDHKDIHPKMLKRIQFGPLYSEAYSANIPDLLKNLFESSPNSDDFILFIEHEVVVSEKRKASVWSGREHEIFLLPKSDPELFERHASAVDKYVLLPHALSQQVSDQIAKELSEHEHILCNREGELYVTQTNQTAT